MLLACGIVVAGAGASVGSSQSPVPEERSGRVGRGWMAVVVSVVSKVLVTEESGSGELESGGELQWQEGARRGQWWTRRREGW